jgi:hypothetical protein
VVVPVGTDGWRWTKLTLASRVAVTLLRPILFSFLSAKGTAGSVSSSSCCSAPPVAEGKGWEPDRSAHRLRVDWDHEAFASAELVAAGDTRRPRDLVSTDPYVRDTLTCNPVALLTYPRWLIK